MNLRITLADHKYPAASRSESTTRRPFRKILLEPDVMQRSNCLPVPNHPRTWVMILHHQVHARGVKAIKGIFGPDLLAKQRRTPVFIIELADVTKQLLAYVPAQYRWGHGHPEAFDWLFVF